eukprot:TRINITY_DN11958_c0_g2_i2.p1 TRINITY_DN11958_c0_g2~~TRINITY_DN11958_c0_g2_i2.p1  ORF type:complete len:505 (+),score=52.20 TRINITY_DN11958_c0_g2_i2:130-1644(+)
MSLDGGGLHFNLGDHEQTLAGIYTSYFKGERHESIKTVEMNVSSLRSSYPYHTFNSYVLTTAALESKASILKTFPNLSDKAVSALDALGLSHCERLQSLGAKLDFGSTVAVTVGAVYLSGHVGFIAALLSCIPESSSVHLELSWTTVDLTCGNLSLLARAMKRLLVESLTLSNSSLLSVREIAAGILTPALRSLRVVCHDAKGKLSLHKCTHLQELRIEAAENNAGVISAFGLNRLYINALHCEDKVKIGLRSDKYPWVEYNKSLRQRPRLPRDHLLVSSIDYVCDHHLKGTFRWLSVGYSRTHREIRVDATILRCNLRHEFHTKSACKAVMLYNNASMPTDVQKVYGDTDMVRQLAKRFPEAFFKVVDITASQQDDFVRFPTPSPIVIIDHSHRFTVDDYGTLLMTWYNADVKLSGLLPLLSLLIALRVRGVSIGDANIARIMVQLAAGAGITPQQAREKAHHWGSNERVEIYSDYYDSDDYSYDHRPRWIYDGDDDCCLSQG